MKDFNEFKKIFEIYFLWTDYPYLNELLDGKITINDYFKSNIRNDEAQLIELDSELEKYASKHDFKYYWEKKYHELKIKFVSDRIKKIRKKLSKAREHLNKLENRKRMMNQERFEQLGVEFGFEDEAELVEQLKEYHTLCIENAKRDNPQ